MSLFHKEDFKSSAGLDLTWKIECDALTDDDWECIAHMIMERTKPFRCVVGIERGGTKLAKLLDKYSTEEYLDPVCIVDDVLTTGNSMEECRKGIEKNEIDKMNMYDTFPGCKKSELAKHMKNHGYRTRPIGWVVFARDKCPMWINPLFQMTPNYHLGNFAYHNKPSEKEVTHTEQLNFNY
jgi:hypoxanthine phosphoribosyltransferase